MRIIPNQPRLRLVALACWIVGCWCLVEGARLLAMPPISRLLALGVVLLGLLALATGVAFWLIGTDQRAGITFDTKGILLNLGHSSAFVGWGNIRRIGVTRQRASVLSIGSPRQLGIALLDTEQYVQSYEARLPAARGPLSGALHIIHWLLHRSAPADDHALRGALAACRTRTGYDLLIPEALLGRSAEEFAALLDRYWQRSGMHG